MSSLLGHRCWVFVVGYSFSWPSVFGFHFLGRSRMTLNANSIHCYREFTVCSQPIIFEIVSKMYNNKICMYVESPYGRRLTPVYVA